MTRVLSGSTLLVTLLLLAPASADEKLPPDQQAKAEEAVKKSGFVRWKEIELDDGMIEVDDAIDGDGKQFDLKLDPKTYEIVKRKAE